MKNRKIVLMVVLAALLALVFTGCGPKGGVIRVVNETSYQLTEVKITLGSSKVSILNPGEWMEASVDKNVVGARVFFKVPEKFSLISIPPLKPENFVEVPKYGTSWGTLTGQFKSSLIGVKDGELVIVTVKNKITE